jgi:sugar lactone lactonase YvrE
MNKPAIHPQRWTPPVAVRTPRPLPLTNLQIHHMPGVGPEHVLPADNGHLLTGLEDGRVIDYDPSSREHRVIVNTGGRPLGLAWHPDGSLIICDTIKGLLQYRPAENAVHSLAAGFNGTPFTFCSNVIAAADGTIYFTHSTKKYNLDNWTGDILEHRPTGQLFRLSPDGTLELLLDELGFANGVTLAPDETFLVVAETIGYDLLKVDLSGDRQGRVDRFGDPLPGFPDNIATGADGNIWVSTVAPRIPAIDFLLPRHPWLRKLVWALPGLEGQAKNEIAVRVFDMSGAIVYDFFGTHPDFANPTAVAQPGNTAWLAGIRANALASFDVPPAPAAPHPTAASHAHE